MSENGNSIQVLLMCHTCQMFKPCKSFSRLKLCKIRSDISHRGWKTILSVVRNIQAKLMISQVSPSTIANSQLEKFFTSCLEKLKSEMDGNKFRNKNILWSLFERITSLGKALTLYLREFSNSPLKPLGILSSFCCCANH